MCTDGVIVYEFKQGLLKIRTKAPFGLGEGTCSSIVSGNRMPLFLSGLCSNWFFCLKYSAISSLTHHHQLRHYQLEKSPFGGCLSISSVTRLTVPCLTTTFSVKYQDSEVKSNEKQMELRFWWSEPCRTPVQAGEWCPGMDAVVHHPSPPLQD